MAKEKLVITMELEDLPENAQVMDFSVRIMQDGWLTLFFKDWKKITLKRVNIKKIAVTKQASTKS